MKIENRSLKRIHKLVGIGFGRIRTFQFFRFRYDSVAYDPMKITLSESEAEADEPTNHKARNRVLWLLYFSSPASGSENLVFTES